MIVSCLGNSFFKLNFKAGIAFVWGGLHTNQDGTSPRPVVFRSFSTCTACPGRVKCHPNSLSDFLRQPCCRIASGAVQLERDFFWGDMSHLSKFQLRYPHDSWPSSITMPHGMPYTARGPHVDRVSIPLIPSTEGLVKEHTLQPIHNLRHLRRR